MDADQRCEIELGMSFTAFGRRFSIMQIEIREAIPGQHVFITAHAPLEPVETLLERMPRGGTVSLPEME